MKFRSEIDIWLAITMIGSAAVSATAAYCFASRASGMGQLISLMLLAVGAGLPLWLLCFTAYQIQDGDLNIRCGPFRWNLRISDVTRVTQTRSPIASPALSLDRLRIEYGRGKVVLVSPQNREVFLQALGVIDSLASQRKV